MLAYLLFLLLSMRGYGLDLGSWLNVGDHWRSLLKQPCPWSVDPPTSIREALAERVVGQEDALANITEVVQSWWDDSVSGRHRPLVLVFTGPTGVGKTEAAQAVARGLLRASTRTLDGVGSVPLGLLEFRGEHFMDESNVTRLRETLREEVAKALYVCAGHAVVVFDEVQKAHKPALTELLALMQGENSRVKGLDASRLVILFTSDTGLSVIDRLVEGGGGGKEGAIARHRFNERLRRKLNDEFEAAGVPLGSLASNIIPFLPMGAPAVRAVVGHHTHVSRLPNHLKGMLDSLVVEPEALTLLASMAYVPYTSWGWAENDTVREETRRCMGLSGGQPGGGAGGGGGGGGSATIDASTGRAKTDSGEDPSSSGFTICGLPCTVDPSCSSKGGARQVTHFGEGPVKRVIKLLSRGEAGQWLKSQDLPAVVKKKALERGAVDASVEVRVGVACALPAVKTLGLCSKEGYQGVGLRVTRCVVSTMEGGETDSQCAVAFEGALP
jgi:hypothetical protein